MQLTREPVTEREYWEAIEGLGGFIWRMNHDLADGRIPDPDGSIAVDIASAREIQVRLVSEAGEKFGVIPLDQVPGVELGQERPPAPDGKIYYWDWYERMKTEVLTNEYEGIVCSACPFSGGLDKFLSASIIPCTVIHGTLFKLRKPHLCGMVSDRSWTSEQLYEEIASKHGGEALEVFQQKEALLKEVAQNTSST